MSRQVLLPVLKPGTRLKAPQRHRIGRAIAKAVRTGESRTSDCAKYGPVRALGDVQDRRRDRT